jgi:serine/threonine-protein kinase
MGVVYQGTDPVRHRSVAIKALHIERPDAPEHLDGVLREAKLLNWLQHPNVARIYGIERERGIPYLVIERVEGQSLAQRLDHGALSIVETIDVGLQIADALGAAHALGIVHRDIKPANVMLTAGGLAKVLDFGVGRYLAPANVGVAAVTADLSSGPMSSCWGTPGYMSPDRLRDATRTRAPMRSRSGAFCTSA